VRGLPSVFGELPAVALAEEIDTPGPGGERLRGLVTFAGNPVVSVPGGDRLAAALSGLDVMVSVDAYRNETTRFAHVVLPAPSPLARGHYDVVFANLAVRNVARWSPPSLPLGPDDRDGADVLLRLAALAAGPGVTADQVDDVVAAQLAHRAATDPSSRALGRDPADLLAAVAPRRRVERLLDLALRSGPYGDGFGAYPDGLTLARLEEHRHGVDLGPLQPRLPEVLRTPSGAVELAPEPLLGECARLAERLAGWVADGAPEQGLVLVGRRQLRSNNSWLHTLPLLTGGSNRCTLQVHPEDAARLGLADGEPAVLRSASGEVVVPVEVTDVVAPGVVCLPHGWSPDTGGVTSNLLAGTGVVEPLSGTAVLNGIPVEVAAT
jgi:anaerobic selenocysteine-containing dehydrogenase